MTDPLDVPLDVSENDFFNDNLIEFTIEEVVFDENKKDSSVGDPQTVSTPPTDSRKLEPNVGEISKNDIPPKSDSQVADNPTAADSRQTAESSTKSKKGQTKSDEFILASIVKQKSTAERKLTSCENKCLKKEDLKVYILNQPVVEIEQLSQSLLDKYLISSSTRKSAEFEKKFVIPAKKSIFETPIPTVVSSNKDVSVKKSSSKQKLASVSTVNNTTVRITVHENNNKPSHPKSNNVYKMDTADYRKLDCKTLATDPSKRKIMASAFFAEKITNFEKLTALSDKFRKNEEDKKISASFWGEPKHQQQQKKDDIGTTATKSTEDTSGAADVPGLGGSGATAPFLPNFKIKKVESPQQQKKVLDKEPPPQPKPVLKPPSLFSVRVQKPVLKPPSEQRAAEPARPAKRPFLLDLCPLDRNADYVSPLDRILKETKKFHNSTTPANSLSSAAQQSDSGKPKSEDSAIKKEPDDGNASRADIEKRRRDFEKTVARRDEIVLFAKELVSALKAPPGGGDAVSNKSRKPPSSTTPLSPGGSSSGRTSAAPFSAGADDVITPGGNASVRLPSFPKEFSYQSQKTLMLGVSDLNSGPCQYIWDGSNNASSSVHSITNDESSATVEPKILDFTALLSTTTVATGGSGETVEAVLVDNSLHQTTESPLPLLNVDDIVALTSGGYQLQKRTLLDTPAAAAQATKKVLLQPPSGEKEALLPIPATSTAKSRPVGGGPKTPPPPPPDVGGRHKTLLSLSPTAVDTRRRTIFPNNHESSRHRTLLSGRPTDDQPVAKRPALLGQPGTSGGTTDLFTLLTSIGSGGAKKSSLLPLPTASWDGIAPSASSADRSHDAAYKPAVPQPVPPPHGKQPQPVPPPTTKVGLTLNDAQAYFLASSAPDAADASLPGHHQFARQELFGGNNNNGYGSATGGSRQNEQVLSLLDEMDESSMQAVLMELVKNLNSEGVTLSGVDPALLLSASGGSSAAPPAAASTAVFAPPADNSLPYATRITPLMASSTNGGRTTNSDVTQLKSILVTLLNEPSSILRTDFERRIKTESLIPVLDELERLDSDNPLFISGNLLGPIMEFAKELIELSSFL